MSKDEDAIRREAAAMQQGQFQGEVLVSLDQLKQSDTKQWTAIENLNAKSEHAQTIEKCENHRRRLSNMNLLKIVGGIIAAIGGTTALLVLLM